MAISSISNQLYNNYQSLASGKRINSAADDAAGLAIAQELQKQVNGYDAGSRNVGTFQDMLKVADGALSTISDSLQRMRELSLQASNTAIYSPGDINSIQQEIEQLKQSIAGTASQTQFNGKNILDGSMGNSHVATGPGSQGFDIQMPNAVLESLGIADYDVTKDFDISTLDAALDKVNSARSSLGASSNTLDYVLEYNANASYNTTAAQSRIEDLDYPQAVSELKKNQLLQTFQLMMQRRQLENENGRVLQLYRS